MCDPSIPSSAGCRPIVIGTTYDVGADGHTSDGSPGTSKAVCRLKRTSSRLKPKAKDFLRSKLPDFN